MWDTDCLRLAQFHSIAVDYPKTGVVRVPRTDCRYVVLTSRLGCQTEGYPEATDET